MKLSKNFLTILSLSVSVIGIILIYLASVNIQPKEISLSDISAEMEGRNIVTTGHITEKRTHKDGHLFLTISDNKADIQVPLFADFMKELDNLGITTNDFQINDRISVNGILEIFNGNLQIIPKSLDDIKILGG